MSQTIVITSGKGGVGKTTVSAFMGARLASRGKRVVVCDLDFGLNNLDIVMGTEKQVVYDLTDVLSGRCRASQAIVECQEIKNLFMLSSEHFSRESAVNANNLKMLINGLQDAFDYVILDCPAGIDVGFHRAVASADRAIVVITANLSSLRDADKVLSVLRSYNFKNIGLVVNMARGDLMLDGLALSVGEIEELLKTKVVGLIPQDDAILVNKNCYLSTDYPSGIAFKKLADSILSDKVRLFNPTKAYSGVIGSIKRSIKRNI